MRLETHVGRVRYTLDAELPPSKRYALYAELPGGLYFTFTRSSAPDQQAFIPVALLDQYAEAKLAEYKAQLLARAATLLEIR